MFLVICYSQTMRGQSAKNRFSTEKEPDCKTLIQYVYLYSVSIIISMVATSEAIYFCPIDFPVHSAPRKEKVF